MSKLLTVRQAAERLEVSESYLNQRRSSGGGPPFCKIGRSVRYREEDLDEYVSRLAFRSTSEYEGSASK